MSHLHVFTTLGVNAQFVRITHCYGGVPRRFPQRNIDLEERAARLISKFLETNIESWTDYVSRKKDLDFPIAYPEALLAIDRQKRNILFHKNALTANKDLLVELYPESLCQKDCHGKSILFYEEVPEVYKSLLVEKFPEFVRDTPFFLFEKDISIEYKNIIIKKFPEVLKGLDSNGRNILFYDHPPKWKDLLLKKYPDELFRIDDMGRNILFYGNDVDDAHKNLLIKKNPGVLCKLDNEGRNILFYKDTGDHFKKLLVKKHPESLCCVTNNGENLLFRQEVGGAWKKMLVENHPESLRQITSEGRSILFYKSIDYKYRKLVVDEHPDILRHRDNNGENILFRGKNAGQTFKILLLKLYPEEANLPNNKGYRWNGKPGHQVVEADEGVCPICQDDFVPGEKVIRQRCRHYIHEPCLDLAKNYRCYCLPKKK